MLLSTSLIGDTTSEMSRYAILQCVGVEVSIFLLCLFLLAGAVASLECRSFLLYLEESHELVVEFSLAFFYIGHYITEILNIITNLLSAIKLVPPPSFLVNHLFRHLEAAQFIDIKLVFTIQRTYFLNV